jgi:uncharacterized membrane protein YGL010W
MPYAADVLYWSATMKTLGDQLTNYATYHRDRRNIATHFVGIPMIFVAVVMLLSRPVFATLGGLALSPASLVGAGAVAFYFALDRRFGATMAALTALTMWGSARVAAFPTSTWLGVGVGLFVVGWIVQFVGHVFEGKKPAFVDDLIGLLVGPLFVVAEVAFALGLRPEVLEEIERRAGPTRVGKPTASSPSPSASQ